MVADVGVILQFQYCSCSSSRTTKRSIAETSLHTKAAIQCTRYNRREVDTTRTTLRVTPTGLGMTSRRVRHLSFITRSA